MTRRVPTMCVTWVKLRSELRDALRSRSTPTCSNEGGRPLGRAAVGAGESAGGCEAARGDGSARAVRVWYAAGGRLTRGLRRYRNSFHRRIFR